MEEHPLIANFIFTPFFKAPARPCSQPSTLTEEEWYKLEHELRLLQEYEEEAELNDRHNNNHFSIV